MRKSWIWATAGLALAAIGWGVWSVTSGAEASLRAHEARVSADIDALRARLRERRDLQRNDPTHRKTLDVLRGASPAGDLAWLPKVLYPNPSTIMEVLTGWVDSGYFYPYEHGSRRSIVGVNPQWDEADMSAWERVLVAMDVEQEFSRGHGTWESWRRTRGEMDILLLWGDMLRDRDLKLEELARMAAGLDRLWASRPTVAEEVETELAWFSRALILELLEPGSSNERAPRLMRPGWRDLFSRTLLGVRLLNEAMEQRDLFREAETMPIRERAVFMAAALDGREPRSEYLQNEWKSLHELDASARLIWTLARTATAVALYRAETVGFPDTLEKLVPRHLTRVPECPKTGRPLIYKPGEVSSPHVDPKLRTAWPVR